MTFAWDGIFCSSLQGGGCSLAVAGLTGIHQHRITLKKLSEAVSSCSPSKSGICRWAPESSIFQERLSPSWIQAGPEPGLSRGFSAVRKLLWLCSQTNIWGSKGSRVRLLCPLARWCGGAGIEMMFYARGSVILLKHLALGKDYQAQLPLIF